MLYPILHWFANNHCSTTFNYSTFQYFKSQELFTVEETDSDFQSFVKEFGDTTAFWEIIDYSLTPVGHYHTYQKDLHGITGYLNSLYQRDDFVFAHVFTENDELLEKIHQYFNGEHNYELAIVVNSNNLDYQELPDSLNQITSTDGKNAVILETAELSPHHRLLEMIVHKVICLETGDSECMYYRAGVLTPGTLSTMLTEILDVLTKASLIE